MGMNRREEFMQEIYDYMQDAKVTVDGKEVDIDMILPTSSHAQERSDLEEDDQTMYTNLDAPGLMSGRMEWSEVAVDTPMHSNCGRSGHHGGSEKRARIIALQNEVVTKNLTSTSTITSTAASTSTFPVTLACTSSGATFAIPMCTTA